MKTEKFAVYALIVTVLFAQLSLYIPSAYSQLQNFVIIEPSEPDTAGIAPYAIAIGQVVMVNVTIQNAVNIYGYNITFYWSNPQIVEYLDVYFQPFLDEPYTSLVRRIGGRITVYAKSEAPAKPVNGAGPLVTLYYKGKNLGESLISFDAVNCWLISQDGTTFHPSTYKRGKLVVTNTKVMVEPEEISGPPNTLVKANITVYKVQNLYGVEFNVTWNPEILTLTRAHYQVPWSNKFEVINKTGLGYYSLAVSGMYPATPYTGNFTFVNLEFNVTKTGLTLLKLKTSKIGDNSGKPIAHAKTDAVFSNVKTTIGFDPSVIADVGLAIGTQFSVNLIITEAVGLKDFEIRVAYPKILNVSDIIPNELYLSDFNFTVDPITSVADITGSFFTELIGNFSVATLEFQVTGLGAGKIMVIDSKSVLKDSEGNTMPFKTSICTFMNWRNIGVSHFDISCPVRIGEKFPVDEPKTVEIKVENLGASAENVTLVVSYQGNVTIEGESKIVNGTIYNTTFVVEKFGSANSSRLVAFKWNTTNLEAGVYIITANATIEVDHDLADNVVTRTLQLVRYAVDIAIVNVLVTPLNIQVNETVSIAVIVKNLGLTTQTFNLLVYLDNELIEKFENVTLIGSSGNVFFVTLSFSKPGEYMLNCTIPAVSEEKALQNNVYTVTLRVGLAASGFPFEIVATLAVVIAVVLVAVTLYVKRRRL